MKRIMKNMAVVRRKFRGFTMIEMLVVVGIIAILVSILTPALMTVHKKAKEAKQKAQFNAIDMALLAFKGDYGDYPPSGPRDDDISHAYYCGAQKLAEALLGQDLLGFHPNSVFFRSGLDRNGNDLYPYPLDPVHNIEHKQNLEARKGPYLEPESANVFRLGELFRTTTDPLLPERFVLCDSFMKLIGSTTVTYAGTPMLYYKANTSNNLMDGNFYGEISRQIYDWHDNAALIGLGILPNTAPEQNRHRLADFHVFYNTTPPNGYTYKIIDPKASSASGMPRPHRPDSYILISAGADGEYGTSDDICNF